MYQRVKEIIVCFHFTASFQCRHRHQPHEEAAAGSLRAGAEAGQHPRHQSRRRLLPQQEPQTPRSRQTGPKVCGGQREITRKQPHVSARGQPGAKEPLSHAEGHAEQHRLSPRSLHRRAGKTRVPLRARQPQRVCRLTVSVMLWFNIRETAGLMQVSLPPAGMGKPVTGRLCRLEFAPSCEGCIQFTC